MVGFGGGWARPRSCSHPRWQGVTCDGYETLPGSSEPLCGGLANSIFSGVCYLSWPEAGKATCSVLALNACAAPFWFSPKSPTCKWGQRIFPPSSCLRFPVSSKTKQIKETAKEQSNCGQAFCQGLMEVNISMELSAPTSCPQILDVSFQNERWFFLIFTSKALLAGPKNI